MPEPVVAHVIGTVALLSVALLVAASFAIAQYLNYVQMLNVMLSEVAEACARQIVELVSIHTLGGGEYTYMLLTLPPSLGGQPYNITLENLGENKMMVVAQLQLHRQVRIVVTPNFGQAPVYAVTTAMRLGDLTVSPTILLPTPPGWRAALVAVRSGDSILIGLTTQPPTSIGGGRSPECRFLDWTRSIVGSAGSTARINFTIFNVGDAPSDMLVELVDDSGRKIAERIVRVEGGDVHYGSIPISLTLPGGTHTWNLVCTPGPSGPAIVVVRLEVAAPLIEVLEVTNPLVGEPGATVPLTVTLRNAGRVKGTVSILLSDAILLSEAALLPGERKSFTLEVQLPEAPGSYSAQLKVQVLETGEVRPVPVTLMAIGSDPYIAWVNSTVVGLPRWRPRLHVRIANPSSRAVTVDVAVDGRVLGTFSVPASSTLEAVVRPEMPAQRGHYTWQVELQKDGLVVSSANVLVEVRDYKVVGRNHLFIRQGALTVERGSKLCGKEPDKQKDRCVILHTLVEGLEGRISLGIGIAVRVYLPRGNVDRGIGLLRSDRLYEVSASVTGTDTRLQIWSLDRKIDPTKNQWDFRATSDPAKVPSADYYPLHVLVACDGTSCRFDAHLYGTAPPLSLRGHVRGGIPSNLSLLVDSKGEFMDVLITRGDPRYVTVEGVPRGWTVELWDGSQLVARSSDGKLNVATSYILNDARLRFIDPYNEPLAQTWRIGQLAGGDVIVFSAEP